MAPTDVMVELDYVFGLMATCTQPDVLAALLEQVIVLTGWAVEYEIAGLALVITLREGSELRAVIAQPQNVSPVVTRVMFME